MYSVRITTNKHGNSMLYVLLFVLFLTIYLSVFHGPNYFAIYCASAILHIIIETGLNVSGIRKGTTHLFGKKLSRAGDVLLRSLLEGPAYCVPAFFVAEQYGGEGFYMFALGAFAVVGLGSLYLGLSDRRQIRRLKSNEKPEISRREMTRPGAVMLLALINTICLIAILTMSEGYRTHTVVYLISYSVFVMFYYFINYNLGVRMIEMYDSKKEKFYRPKPMFQAFGLTYDSAYEMALLISPAYWITFYLGFLN